MKLDTIIDSECFDTAFWMAGVYDADLPFSQMGQMASEVCRKLRTIAISVLCAQGKVNAFYHNLIRSGMVRERYLSRCEREQQLFDHFRSSGWYAPLMDTLAAGEMDLARRLAALSPTGFHEGHEYEDDYCYAQLIYHLLGAGKEEVGALLGRFEAYCEGEQNDRLELIKSLLSGAQADFDRAMNGLLLGHKQMIDTEIEGGRFEDLHVNADRRVFVEGLAILRLAERRGLKTEEEYLFCPRIARLPMTQPFPGE